MDKKYYVVEEFDDGSLQIATGEEAEEFIKNIPCEEIRIFKETNN